MKLSDVALISAGRTFRTAVKEDVRSPYKVLQLSNINHDIVPAVISWDGLINVEMTSSKEVETLQMGQIVLVAKGSKKPAFYLDSVEDNVVATQHFLIVKPTEKAEINSRFIWAYINSEYAQHWLMSKAGGSYQSSLSKKVLSDLPVPEISIERQQHVADCYMSVQRELALYNAMSNARTTQINNVFSEIVQEQGS